MIKLNHNITRLLACSRLLDSGEDEKEKGTQKVGGVGKRRGKRKGNRASNHFFHNPLLPTFGMFEIITGLLIFRGKKTQNFAGFSGANSWKNWPISRDFRGRKVKIRRKIGQFRGILAEKSQILKDFQGKFLEKSADFTGNFWGKLLQETISKKQPISPDFFGKFR